MPFIDAIADELRRRNIDYKVNADQTELNFQLTSEHKVESLRGPEVNFSVSIMFIRGEEHFEYVRSHQGASEGEKFDDDEAEATAQAIAMIDEFCTMVGGDGGSYAKIDKFMAYHREMADLAEALDGLRDRDAVERRREPPVF